MAETIILIRRSGNSGSVPPSGTLQFGELALNMTDGGVFYHDTGSDSVELIRAGTASFALNAGDGGDAGTASFLIPVGFTAFKPIQTIANTNPYNVVAPDHTLLIDASSGSAPITVQLPGVALFMSGAAARIIHVIKATGSNDVEILPSGSETVTLDVSASLTDVQQGLTLQPSGSNWWAI